MEKDYYKARSIDPVPQIASRINGAYHRFLAGFEESRGIHHRLSKGEARENPVSDFFESLLPQSLGVTSGEIIDFHGTASPQSDLIIYRKSDGIPVLKDRPTILQVESVLSVAEVKSKITSAEYADCLSKADKILRLRPFNRAFRTGARGASPTGEECRIFLSIFAYSSDIDGDLNAELRRYEAAAKTVNVKSNLVDRIYILGKGVINPVDRAFASDTQESKRGLFYFYSNMLNFIMRESRRRKPVPYLRYFGRMSDGWKPAD